MFNIATLKVSHVSHNREYLSFLSAYIIIPIIPKRENEAIWLKQSKFLNIVSITYAKNQQIKFHGPNSVHSYLLNKFLLGYSHVHCLRIVCSCFCIIAELSNHDRYHMAYRA